jgi:hypothetical protein
MSVTDGFQARNPLPHNPRKLVEVLKQPAQKQGRNNDDWFSLCHQKFRLTAWALCKLVATQGMWPTERWRTALQTWSTDGFTQRSWRCLAQVVEKIPDNNLEDIADSLAGWLAATARDFTWPD